MCILARGGHDAISDDIAVHDAAEDIDENAADVWIGQDDLKGGGNLFLRRAAADIEEVRGPAAVVLDDVHGGHGQAGAIDQAGDVPIKTDVVEIVLAGRDFAWIFFGFVAQCRDLRLPKERVVVEVEFRVEREAASRWG
jgi:hypothetical protein